MKLYQLVFDVPCAEKYENLIFSEATFVAEFESRGFKLNGKEGADYLRAEIVGEPKFDGLFGPTWGGFDGPIPIVRYESYHVANLLSS